MINLGVAVSIAKNPRYSWEYTIDFCTTNQLSLIQFYWQYPIPLAKKSEALSVQHRYFHMPGELNSLNSIPDLSLACGDFRKQYESNKLIIHQQGDNGSDPDGVLIGKLNSLDCVVGFENHQSESLAGFQNSLYVWHQRQYQFFVVFDVHKFFNRFYHKYQPQEILQAIIDLFQFCHELNLILVLHIIDSKSFLSNQSTWCPVFDGIVPYVQIFDSLRNGQIECEGLILEYEEERMALESIKRLRQSKM